MSIYRISYYPMTLCLEWSKTDLTSQLARVKAEQSETTEDMIDVVNDLKTKEDELGAAHRDLAAANRRLDDLCKQLLKQEDTHQQVGWING